MLTLTNDLLKLYEKKVLFIAKKYSNSNTIEDLYQQGMKGLIEASKNYDENYGVSFSTFSELYIKGEILDFIRKDKNIKVTRDFIRLKKKVDIATNEYYENKKAYPTIEELSYILNEDKAKILTVLNIDQNVKSLEDTLTDNEELQLKDTISDNKSNDLTDLIALKDALNNLSKEEKNIIDERYFYGKTQSELAKDMNISQVKVYRMERKILDKLESKLAC